MFRVAIDVRMTQHTGVGRYIRGLVPNLVHNQNDQRYSLIGNKEFRSSFPSQLDFVETSVSIYSLREQIIIPWIAKNNDCLHVPHYNAPLFRKGKLVVTIHDLIHLHFKDDLPSRAARFYAATMLPKIVKRADRIIAVSQFTKNDLIQTLRADPQKITVVHHGLDPDFLKPDQAKHSAEQYSHQPYFLCVGLIKKHKNTGVLIDAFQRFIERNTGTDMKLVIVGHPDQKQPIVQEWLAKIEAMKAVEHLSNLGDSELIRLYRGARALIIPSLYEGFGFPLLEAMAAEIPIIASRGGSIPEIAGENAALYFNPNSSSELEKCMERLVQDSSLRQRLVEEGRKRRTSFNWNECARKTQLIYESILQ